MRVLIVDSGNPRGTFAAARYLRRAGWSVSIGTADTRGPASWSRATVGVYEVTPVERGLDAFLASTVEAVRASRSKVVLPGSDAELLALSHGRDRIPAIVPLADDAVVRRSVDKLELVRAAQDVGLPAPETASADDETLQRVRYPVVIKSRFHWLPEHSADAPTRLDATVCGDPATARARVEEMERFGGEPLVQELVDGTPVGVHLVSDRSGDVLAMLQQDSAPLFYPPRAGVRVRSITTPLDPALEPGIRALMRELGWFGFAGLAFLRGDDGVSRLIDFNGRVPSSLEASAGAGANYVPVWAAMAIDRPVPPIPRPQLGKRFHNLECDLRRALRERRGGLLRDLAGTLAQAPRAQHTIAKWDDPLVVVRYSARLLRESWSARRRRRG